MSVEVETEPEFKAGTAEMLFEGIYALGGIMGTQYDVSLDGERFLMLAPATEDPEGHRIAVIENWFEELKRLVPVEGN